jgi:hypothetical protein
MKKTYNTPSINIVDVKIDAVMVCASCNIHQNGNGFTFNTQDATGSAWGGDEMDAASYRSNLWKD